MECAHRRHESDRAGAARFERFARAGDRPHDLHRRHLGRVAAGDARGRGGEDEIELLELRALRADDREVPLDRLPVAARDRPGELEVRVHDSADERIERLGRRARRLEQRPRGGAERDEVVRRHRRARVVRGALVVVELERAQAERLGEPPADVASLVGLGRHRSPDAVELLGAAQLRERLQWVQAEATRREGRARRAVSRR